MYSIEKQIEIAAKPARIVEALTTKTGIQGWWTQDTEVTDREAVFRFERTNRLQMRFRIDQKDAARVAMECVGETNNADWLGTRLVFELAPAGDRTRVALVHSGYRANNESYAMCTKGWEHYLGSLKRYIETGVGEPSVPSTQVKDIVDRVEIAAPPAGVLAALTTTEGIASWWTQNNTVTPTEHTYRFGRSGTLSHATFRIERQDARGLALVCTDENNMGWLGTRLAFSVERSGAGTRVALTHAGFPLASACYDECVRGWKHFLGSLKAFAETGTGTPHVPAVNDCHK